MAHPPLTEREREVVRCLASGLTAPETAKALGISSGVVRNHRMNVYRKLRINRATVLARWAMEHGMARRRNGRKGAA